MLKKNLILVVIIVTIIFLSACQNQNDVPIFNADENVIEDEQTSSAPSDNAEQAVLVIPETEKMDSKKEDIIVYENANHEGINPYEAGQVMIIMYHDVLEEETASPYHRSVNDFKNDLQRLYDGGYRISSLKNLMDNNVTVDAGYTPVVITFDDGLAGTFSLVEEDGSLALKKNCGLYILEEFAKEHPDFGYTATLFINGNNAPFPGAGEIGQRLKWLVDNGYDLGNHTYGHSKLNEKNAHQIQQEIGLVDRLIKDCVPGYTPVGISYPYGIRPVDELLKFTLSGEHEGEDYSYDFALKEGYNALKPPVPSRKGFDKLSVSRVRGSNSEDTDLGYFIDFYEKNPEYRYVSDGDPDTICVPSRYKDNINYDNLEGKTLIIIDED